MSESENQIRLQVLFSGRVQGVGFRYTCLQISALFELTGFVRNLPGGDVELVLEGSPKQIAEMIDQIESKNHGEITGKESRKSEFSGDFEHFEIRH